MRLMKSRQLRLLLVPVRLLPCPHRLPPAYRLLFQPIREYPPIHRSLFLGPTKSPTVDIAVATRNALLTEVAKTLTPPTQPVSLGRFSTNKNRPSDYRDCGTN